MCHCDSTGQNGVWGISADIKGWVGRGRRAEVRGARDGLSEVTHRGSQVCVHSGAHGRREWDSWWPLKELSPQCAL